MTKICVSLTEPSTEALVDRMSDLSESADMFEIRGDLIPDLDLLTLIRVRTKPMLFCCRSRAEGGGWDADDALRRQTLLEAMRRGFDYVDVEHQSGFQDIMLEKTGKGLLVSYHDLHGTPENLPALYKAMCATGADIVKIAVTPKSMEDVGRLLRMAREVQRDGGPPLIAIAMGPMGLITRVGAGRLGAPFTFAASEVGREVAPGQIAAREMADVYRVRDVGPETKLFGVVGADVVRSLSPVLHNRAFQEVGLRALYVPLQTDSLVSFLKVLPDLDLSGFSVTRPFKTEILSHLAQLDESAAESGSVNTVIVREGSLVGMSTDGLGVVSPLKKRTKLRGARVAILGAGGAARAAARALVQKGAKATLLGRNLYRVQEVARSLGCASGALSTLPSVRWDVLVNATPVGDRDAPGETLVERSLLRKGSVVFDMVYDPIETRLLREAREAGCTTIDGLEMLVAQAAAQFEAWTGREAPIEAMHAAGLAAQKASP